jgi:hypothetical protein
MMAGTGAGDGTDTPVTGVGERQPGLTVALHPARENITSIAALTGLTTNASLFTLARS